MARILCAFSGIEFTCEHFPLELHSREYAHPIFFVPQRKLLSYIGKWSAGELTPTDSYLLFLALLRSSEQVDFRVPVSRSPLTDSIVANNMEYLSTTVFKLNSVYNPRTVFPSFAITPETRFLSNVHHWIETWDEAYEEFKSGLRVRIAEERVERREQALEKLIRNPFKNAAEYGSKLAEWASLAASFPASPSHTTYTNTHTQTVDSYWKEIISHISRQEYIFSYPIEDIEKLLEHCEDHIPAGSILAHKLFSILRENIDKQRDFLGATPRKKGMTHFEILGDGEDSSVEQRNLSVVRENSPESEPQKRDYPSTIAYLKAKMAWTLRRSTDDAPNTGT